MIANSELREWADWEHGLMSPHLFSSQALYELELERLFGKCWLFLAHDSQLPRFGDFFATYMGADPVLVVRQQDGSVGAYLNACRHRGMKVCRADEGNARAFTCTYHGWAYDTAGRLIDIPNLDDAYKGGLERSEWGLVPVARVEQYKGFIFGCFDDAVEPLDDFLGDAKYYFDVFVDGSEAGVEFYGGVQKSKLKGNWKLAAEQFAGDTHHARTSHVSDFAVTIPLDMRNSVGAESKRGAYVGAQQMSNRGHGAGFSVGRSVRSLELQGGDPQLDRYRDEVEPEVSARLGAERAAMFRGSYWHANLFPNLSWLGNPQVMRVWHPKGPNDMEVWQWVFVDKDSPPELKDMHVWHVAHHFGPAGLAEQDDGENFALIGANFLGRGTQVHKLKLNYRMGLLAGASQEAGATLADGIGEMPQRLFYRRWLELMTAPS